MENASKALIIAGAILLAIVIISLGLVVVNNVRSTIDNTNMNAQEIEAFNGKFTPYGGEHVSGSKVNALMATVSSSNANSKQNEEDGLDRQPYIDVYVDDTKKVTGNSDDAQDYPSFQASKYYTVEISMTKGVVSKINVNNP